jgi:hypothetical protein
MFGRPSLLVVRDRLGTVSGGGAERYTDSCRLPRLEGLSVSMRRNPEDRSPEGLSQYLVAYARGVGVSSPLYGRLLLAVADDPDLLALAGAARRDQPAGLLLLAAVHYLLLKGAEPLPPLAGFYPGVAGGAARTEDPVPAFREFCLEHRGEIRTLIASRRVQTNEVGRSACLMPAFALASETARGLPLTLVEVGASAGLNLLFDRYAYDYGDGVVRGDAASTVCISCSLRGEAIPPLPEAMPKVASRVGVDLDPVDVRDPDARLWQRALIWPEHTIRAENLRRALEIAQETPPPVVAGDALALLPGILDSIPEDAAPCVFHTHAVYQFAPEDRHRLYALLVERSALRDLVVRIGMEPSEAGSSVLSASIYRHGRPTKQRLADCDYHGAWLAWSADSVGQA